MMNKISMKALTIDLILVLEYSELLSRIYSKVEGYLSKWPLNTQMARNHKFVHSLARTFMPEKLRLIEMIVRPVGACM